jgi:hypothetical protein
MNRLIGARGFEPPTSCSQITFPAMQKQPNRIVRRHSRRFAPVSHPYQCGGHLHLGLRAEGLSIDPINISRVLAVLRVTLFRLPGTFRRHISTGTSQIPTGGNQIPPGPAGSVSELRLSEINATTAGRSCRRSSSAFGPASAFPFPLLSEETGTKRLSDLSESSLPVHLEYRTPREPGIRRCVTGRTRPRPLPSAE